VDEEPAHALLRQGLPNRRQVAGRLGVPVEAFRVIDNQAPEAVSVGPDAQGDLGDPIAEVGVLDQLGDPFVRGQMDPAQHLGFDDRRKDLERRGGGKQVLEAVDNPGEFSQIPGLAPGTGTRRRGAQGLRHVEDAPAGLCMVSGRHARILFRDGAVGMHLDKMMDIDGRRVAARKGG